MQIDNKGKYILILGEWPTQGLDDTTLTAEAKYPINFTILRKKVVLSLHYNKSKKFLFCECYKNISIQSKKLWNKRLCTMFRWYFKRSYN